MSQNIISLTFTEAQITALDAALTELETQLSGCIALDLTKKRALKKMGEKSEAFCRQALHMAELNPQMMPANIPVSEAVADLKALDQLRPRLMRLSRMTQRAVDTDIALGSDVMSVALAAYGQLKLTGKSEGLEPVRRELRTRFVKAARVEEPPVDTAKAA
jgi:hypothetical protein